MWYCAANLVGDEKKLPLSRSGVRYSFDMNISSSIYVTYLEREGTFIKIWGQTDKSLPVSIEKTLQQLTPQFAQGMHVPSADAFQVGVLLCAKFKDDKYYRARVTGLDLIHQNLVEVLFIDYGNKDVVKCINTRDISAVAPRLLSIPPQAREFILANVSLPYNATENHMSLINEVIRYLDVQMITLFDVGYLLISLFINKQDVTITLLERGLVVPIILETQKLMLYTLSSENQGNQQPMPIFPQVSVLFYFILSVDNDDFIAILISYVLN